MWPSRYWKIGYDGNCRYHVVRSHPQPQRCLQIIAWTCMDVVLVFVATIYITLFWFLLHTFDIFSVLFPSLSTQVSELAKVRLPSGFQREFCPMTSPCWGWDRWVNWCRWSQECQTWCQQAVKTWGFQTSKWLVSLEVGILLRHLGCKTLVVPTCCSFDGFLMICCGGRCRKGGCQEDQAVHGPKLKYRFGSIWSLLNRTQNRTLGEIWSFTQIQQSIHFKVPYDFFGDKMFKILADSRAFFREKVLYFDTHLFCRKKVDFRPLVVFSQRNIKSKFDAITSSVFPKLLWPIG